MDPSKSILGIHKTISSLAGHLRKVVIRVGDLEKNVNNQFKKITSLKNISKTQSERISGENIGAKLPGGSTDNVNESLKAIADSLTSIADILAGRKKLTDATAAADRQKAEQDKRALAESKLEKRFDGLKKTAEKIIAPVKSILDRIIDFFVTVFLGRVVYKLLEWFGDPKNADKVKSIFRFLGDQWPKLLTLYLVFGNAFGRFALGLAKGVAAGAVKLAFAIAKLLAAKKVKGAMGAARFLGGGKGKLLANVIGTVATVGGAYALTQGMKGDDGGEQKTQKLAGGGYVTPRFPAFSGGGFNFKGMMGGASMGAMFGPLGMLLGGAFGSGKPQEMVSGFVSGEKGVDKVPAMLSDGEFVMSRGAVQKYGVDTLESMNAAGGGTNKPKMVSGTTYAEGGGIVGADGRNDPSYRINEQKLKEQKSFTQSSRSAAGLDDLAKKFDMDAKTAPRYAENLPKLNRPKPRIPRIDPSRMLPSAGGSSANAMRAAAKAAQNVRPPIPASSAIVPYTGGGLARTGVTGGLSVPQIRTNMNVPGGRIRGGSLSAIMMALEMKQRKDEGQTNVQAGLGAGGSALGGQLGWMAGAKSGAIAGAALGSIVPGLGTGVGAAVGAIVGGLAAGYGGAMLGGKLADDFSGVNAAKERMNRGGIGGAIKGGYGLKDQSFKDMPRTQIMSDDKGRPFVGYKAMRGGRPVYVRGPQPGEGTSNPLEMLGRAINPGAYKDIDAANARKKYDEAAQGSISSLRARSATAATIAKRQAELNKRRPPGPPVKPAPKYTPAGGGMGGGRGGGSRRAAGGASGPPKFSATCPKGGDAKAKTLGLGNRRGG